MRITTRRWAPVDMYDRDTVRGELCSKKFQAEVNHPWASREQRRQVRWYGAGRMLRLREDGSRGRQRVGSAVLHLRSQHSSAEAYGLRITVSHEHPLVAQELALGRKSLRIIWSTTDVRDAHEPSPRSVGHCLRLLPGSCQSPCRVRMRPPAEYHIAQNYGNIRMTSRCEQVLSAHAGVDHRMRSPLGKLLCSQIQDHMRGLMRRLQCVVQIGGNCPQSTPQEP